MKKGTIFRVKDIHYLQDTGPIMEGHSILVCFFIKISHNNKDQIL